MSQCEHCGKPLEDTDHVCVPPAETAELIPSPESPKPNETNEFRPAYETISKRDRNLILFALCCGQFLAALDMTIVVIALSDILTSFGGADEYLAWVLSAYSLTSAVTTALVGRLSDVYGRRRVYLFMLGVFIVGSCLCGAANGIWFLIVSRGVQGLGGGGIMGLTNVVVADIVPPKDRGRIVGFVTATFGFASVSGPALGGVIVTYISWRWVFYINLPVAGFAFLCIFIFLRKLLTQSKDMKLDIVGAVLIVVSASCFVLFITWGGQKTGYPWNSGVIIGLIVATIVVGALFAFQEFRHPLPILRLALLAQRNIALCYGITFCNSGTMMGVIAYLPIYFQQSAGDTAVIAGLKTMPRTAGFLLSAPMAGKLMQRVPLPILLAVGGLLLLTSTAPFVLLTPDRGYWLPAILFVIQGMGMGIIIPVSTVTIQNSAKPQDIAVALAGFSFLGLVGGSIMIAIYGAVFQTITTEALMSHYSPEQAVAMGVARVCVIACAPAGLLIIFSLLLKHVVLKKPDPKQVTLPLTKGTPNADPIVTPEPVIV